MSGTLLRRRVAGKHAAVTSVGALEMRLLRRQAVDGCVADE